MTANEAGETCAGCHRQTFLIERQQCSNPECKFYPPSKPCTKGGDHCFCVEDNTHMLVPRCCWCADPKPQTQRVPGHGPYRTELVRDV